MPVFASGTRVDLVAEVFGDADVRVLDNLKKLPDGITLNLILSTVPATATSTSEFPQSNAIELESNLFAYRDGPAVVLDMAYNPPLTPLLALAKSSASNWITIPGIEVLIEQGICQFELWTKRKCPRTAVSKAVKEKYGM